MSEIKLLPCPCCAEKEHIHIRNYEDFNKDFSSTYKYYVECGVCGLQTEMFASIEEVVKKWNTRKPMERILTRLEERHKNHENNIRKYQDKKDYDMCSRHSNIKVENEISIEIVKEEGGIE